MAKKVKEAINTNQQSANLHEAQTLSSAAREFCSNQRYAEGVSRYSKALQLLGAG
jgi:sRNA-binding protein